MASESSNSAAIGIDLGTTYSCIGVWENGRAEIIVNDQGNRITPSYVAFNDIEMMTGDAAKNQATINHENTIFCAKRLIGHSFDDQNVKEDIAKLPFKVLKRDGKLVIQVELKNEITYLTPEEVSSHLLSYLKKSAEAYIGKPVRDAVITVPAYFNNSQRKSTIDAGKLAGLNVLSILNEPTAAAIAYGIKNRESKKRTVLVFDLGGGTFDISLLSIITENFRVLATVGNAHLGGTDFDTRLVDYFVRLFKKKTRHDISNDSRSLSRLRSQVERAKCILSSQTRSSIEIDSLYEGIDFQESLTRAKFEDLCQDLFLSTIEYLDEILLDSGIERHQVDNIVLVGGSTRICKIQSLVSEYFNGRQLQKTINPDEAVACGATIQATMLTKSMYEIIKEIILVDVTPMSLGIETKGFVMDIVVPRFTALPFRITNRFTTVYDYQTYIVFPVYEGESSYSRSNFLLGEFSLNGFPLALKGVPKFDVTFAVDTDGLLNVKAYSLESGLSNNIDIVYNRSRSSKAKTGNFITL